MHVIDFFSTFVNLAGAENSQERPLDSLDMTKTLLDGAESPRQEIIFEVTGSVRIPTIREGDFKLMGKLLYNIRKDPTETTDVAADHPELVKRLTERLAEVAKERPPLGDKPLLMSPPLPYVYGIEENKTPPDWLIDAVDAARAKQPKSWPPGEPPWPQAPKTPQ